MQDFSERNEATTAYFGFTKGASSKQGGTRIHGTDAEDGEEKPAVHFGKVFREVKPST